MTGSLCDKVAIIAGSSRGIGKGIARAGECEGNRQSMALLLLLRQSWHSVPLRPYLACPGFQILLDFLPAIYIHGL